MLAGGGIQQLNLLRAIRILRLSSLSTSHSLLNVPRGRYEKDDDSTGMELTSAGAGTYWYLPPECFKSSSEGIKISSKVDVWSVGVIYYQCLYGKRPFGDGKSQQEVASRAAEIYSQKVVFPDTPKVSEDAKTFIRDCLVVNDRLRPDALAIARHPYLKKK